MHLDSWYEKLCQKGSKKMKQQLEENLDQGMCETAYTGAYLYPNRKDITETKIQMMQEKEGITEGGSSWRGSEGRELERCFSSSDSQMILMLLVCGAHFE